MKEWNETELEDFVESIGRLFRDKPRNKFLKNNNSSRMWFDLNPYKETYDLLFNSNALNILALLFDLLVIHEPGYLPDFNDNYNITLNDIEELIRNGIISASYKGALYYDDRVKSFPVHVATDYHEDDKSHLHGTRLDPLFQLFNDTNGIIDLRPQWIQFYYNDIREHMENHDRKDKEYANLLRLLCNDDSFESWIKRNNCLAYNERLFLSGFLNCPFLILHKDLPIYRYKSLRWSNRNLVIPYEIVLNYPKKLDIEKLISLRKDSASKKLRELVWMAVQKSVELKDEDSIKSQWQEINGILADFNELIQSFEDYGVIKNTLITFYTAIKTTTLNNLENEKYNKIICKCLIAIEKALGARRWTYFVIKRAR